MSYRDNVEKIEQETDNFNIIIYCVHGKQHNPYGPEYIASHKSMNLKHIDYRLEGTHILYVRKIEG